MRLGWARDLFGNGPHASGQLTGTGPGDHGGVFASCHASSVALPEPDLGLPTDVLDAWRLFFQSQLQVSTDCGGIAIGPGAFAQDASGVGVTGCGHRPLPAVVASRGLRGHQPHALHQCSGGLNACQVTTVGHHGDGHGQWNTTQGLKRLDHWRQTPRCAVVLQVLLQAPKPFGVFVNRTDLCLQDDGLRWDRADHLREPPQVGRAPIGPAHVTDIVSAHEGFETARGVFASADGICTCPSQIAHGFIVDCGDRDGGEITRARQASQLPGSLRCVVTRAPGFVGISEGTTTQQAEPFFVQYR